MYFFSGKKNKLKLLQITKIIDSEKLLVNKFSTTNAIRFNFLQVCPSAILFVFVVLFEPSWNILSGYFYVSLIGAVSRISAKVGNYKLPVKLRETWK